jgi:hypothetical protein
VLALMLHGNFDRSGVFDCDGHQPSHAVTLVTGLPPEVVEVGLKRLLDAKTWVLMEGRLVWPKFIEAQTCRRTDRARQEESRRNRRDSAMGGSGDEGHTESPPVTDGHTPSQPVTPNQAEPSRAKSKAPRERDAELLPPVCLPADWTPDAEANEILVAETQRPVEVIMRQLPGFRDWWLRGKGRGTRRKLSGWRASWMTWIRNSARRGQLDLAPPAQLALASSSPAEAAARAKRAAEIEARARQQAANGGARS